MASATWMTAGNWGTHHVSIPAATIVPRLSWTSA